MVAAAIFALAEPANARKPCTDGSSGACTPSFFPTPRPGVRHHTFHGIVQMFGYGNKSGGMTLIDRAGQTQEFYLTEAGAVLMNGRHVYCTGIRRGHSFECGGWPKSITIGVTPVIVDFFWTTRFDKPARVVDRIQKEL